MNGTILVVDDESKIVKQARDYLERGGFRVVTAGDGTTAMAVARHERPDLIVLDLNLPGPALPVPPVLILPQFCGQGVKQSSSCRWYSCS